MTGPGDATALRIGLAQLEIEAGESRRNLRRALESIERAARAGVDLVVLPELFTVGYFAFDSYARSAEGLAGETCSRLAAAAADHDLWVLGGTFVEDLAATRSTVGDEALPAEDGLANTAVLFDPDGARSLVYRKHHLFGYDSVEADLLVPGEALPVADVGPFTVGVSTCYDLRFPELYRDLVDAGATLLCVPSAWPYPRLEHWETLARARAIENQAFLAAANGAGTFESGTLLGRSSVYDPWGTTLASSDDEPTLVTADLDPARVSRVREEFPALRDRRS